MIANLRWYTLITKPFILDVFKWKSSLGITPANKEENSYTKICSHICVLIHHRDDDQSKWSPNLDIRSAHCNQFGVVSLNAANYSLDYNDLPSYFLQSINIDLRENKRRYHQMHSNFETMTNGDGRRRLVKSRGSNNY